MGGGVIGQLFVFLNGTANKLAFRGIRRVMIDFAWELPHREEMRGTTKVDHAVNATVLDEMFAEFALEAFHISANAHHGHKLTARGITPNG